MRVLRSSRESGNGILSYQNSQSEEGILSNPTDVDPPPKTARSADNGILSYQHSQSEDDILSNPTDGDPPYLAESTVVLAVGRTSNKISSSC